MLPVDGEAWRAVRDEERSHLAQVRLGLPHAGRVMLGCVEGRYCALHCVVCKHHDAEYEKARAEDAMVGCVPNGYGEGFAVFWRWRKGQGRCLGQWPCRAFLANSARSFRPQ